jgi:hypothetical protein
MNGKPRRTRSVTAAGVLLLLGAVPFALLLVRDLGRIISPVPVRTPFRGALSSSESGAAAQAVLESMNAHLSESIFYGSIANCVFDLVGLLIFVPASVAVFRQWRHWRLHAGLVAALVFGLVGVRGVVALVQGEFATDGLIVVASVLLWSAFILLVCLRAQTRVA